MTLQVFLDRLEQEDSNKVLGDVYTECRASCVHWLLGRDNKHDVESAKDIFTEAVLILFDNAERGRIKPSSVQVKTYLTTICRNLQSTWFTREGFVLDEPFDGIIEQIAEDNPDAALERERVLTALETAVAQLEEPCASLIRLFYYEKLSLKQIAEKLGYASADVTRQLVYRCRGSLAKVLNQFFKA